MKRKTAKRLTREQQRELQSLARLPDEAIDRSDAPELADWSDAERGLFLARQKEADTSHKRRK